MEIALSLGSNLGDRLANLRQARLHLLEIPSLELRATSRVYETEPVDVADEHRTLRFLNAVIIVGHPDVAMLAPYLWNIEKTMGRPAEHGQNEPRTIDVDVIYADDRQIRTDGLTIPHPRWAAREFVVRPLNDVRPDRVVPGQTRRVRDVLLSLPAGGGVVPFCDAF